MYNLHKETLKGANMLKELIINSTVFIQQKRDVSGAPLVIYCSQMYCQNKLNRNFNIEDNYSFIKSTKPVNSTAGL